MSIAAQKKQAPARNGQTPESPRIGGEIKDGFGRVQRFIAGGVAAQKSVDGAIAAIERTKQEAADRAGVSVESLGKLPVAHVNGVMKGEGFKMVPVKKTVRSPFNRKNFDPEKMREMTESVREFGVIEPILVRPTAEGYEIIAGERRWRAAREAKLELIPAIVRHLSDKEVIELQITENLQREDLQPIDEARGYQQMREIGYSVDQMAAKLHIGKSTIYARLALLEMPGDAVHACESGKLPASHAEQLTRVPDPDVQRALLKKILKPQRYEATEGGILSFRRAKELVDDKVEELKARRAWEKQMADLTKPGVTVLDFEASRKLLPYHHARPQGYTRLGDCCYDDPKRRTYEALLRKSDIAVTIARDPSGTPVKLVLEKQALAAIAAAGYEFKVASQGESPKNSDAEKSKARAKRESARVNREVWRRANRQLVAAVERGGDTDILLRFIAVQFLGRLCTSSRRGQEVVDARGLTEAGTRHTPEKILRGHVEKGFTGKQLRGFIVEAVVMGEWEPFDFGGSCWRPGFKAACEKWKVDLKRLEEEVRASEKGGR